MSGTPFTRANAPPICRSRESPMTREPRSSHFLEDTSEVGFKHYSTPLTIEDAIISLLDGSAWYPFLSPSLPFCNTPCSVGFLTAASRECIFGPSTSVSLGMSMHEFANLIGFVGFVPFKPGPLVPIPATSSGFRGHRNSYHIHHLASCSALPHMGSPLY
ncbi:hypothetical protein NLI96_g11779 [Meripilus lineatus]|uniref:Uncharacterized protein n=1 Tax=Meripilus lineatus TaxID=2056292 RepID=A0AAD5YD31_9APHY|nr:hypothetical protein NLI96_g11779 [Physisporinus lineatus]